MTQSRRKEIAYRTSWPAGPLRGEFRITEGALTEIERLLPTYRGPDGDHEGICFLCGHEFGDLTLFTTAIAADANHGPGHVHCSAADMTEVTAAARRCGLGVLGQVHSHPGSHTGHSWGDDEMIFMPFEGMLSIVVPHHGRFGLRPVDSLGVHQFQDRIWIRCDRDSVRQRLRVLPNSEDLR